jgi:hypothetical protein
MLIVLLDAALLYDVNAAILGWLLMLFSPKSSIHGTPEVSTTLVANLPLVSLTLVAKKV